MYTNGGAINYIIEIRFRSYFWRFSCLFSAKLLYTTLVPWKQRKTRSRPKYMYILAQKKKTMLAQPCAERNIFRRAEKNERRKRSLSVRLRTGSRVAATRGQKVIFRFLLTPLVPIYVLTSLWQQLFAICRIKTIAMAKTKNRSSRTKSTDPA